jgi:hypothetical protein
MTRTAHSTPAKSTEPPTKEEKIKRLSIPALAAAVMLVRGTAAAQAPQKTRLQLSHTSR